jgi:hypothetical protein
LQLLCRENVGRQVRLSQLKTGPVLQRIALADIPNFAGRYIGLALAMTSSLAIGMRLFHGRKSSMEIGVLTGCSTGTSFVITKKVW